MNRPNSLRVRLTAWYFLSLLAILGILAAGSWVAMRLSLENAVDGILADRLAELISSLRLEVLNRGELGRALRELAGRSGQSRLYRVANASGVELFRSAPLTEMLDGVRLTDPRINRHSQISFRDATRSGQVVLRLGSQTVEFPGEQVLLEVAEPMALSNHALVRFEAQMQWLATLLIVPATIAGFWLSGRALAPINRIIHTARSIDASNLSARLELPRSHDELRRLPETLNAMLERIEESVNRVHQFTADASHELRTPLTLIHAVAESALRRPKSREELEDGMRQVLRESKRTSQLVTDLLLLDRADTHTEPLAGSPVDLTALLHGLRDRAEMLAAPKHINVTFDLPRLPSFILGDESQLMRLFLIIVDNAVKYTPDNGNIVLCMSSDGGACLTTVRDTGIGIAQADLPRIFDRFWRADEVRSRDAGGTGLGLSIARAIVSRHGGLLAAQSELGAGSVFSVMLPGVIEPSKG